MVRSALGTALVLAAVFLFAGAFAPETAYRRSFSPVSVFAHKEKEVAVIFGGDMLFDRSIRIAMERDGDDWVFSCIAELLQSADLVVANLEGPITSHPSKSVGTTPGGEGNYTFTFPTTTAALLARHNIRIVSLGNNHILNFGWWGERETKKWLDDAGVGYFGDPADATVVYEYINDVWLAFVAYNQFAPAPFDSASTTLSQVRKAREKGYLPIVFAHWGEEYVPANDRQRNLARAFVDAGAELVVGSHPHVVQERELYAGRYIYYSLGNFIFDQYWNENVRRGLLLRVVFAPSGVVAVKEIPIDIQRDRRTCAAR